MAAFVKGKSGNPGGRPKIARALEQLGTSAGDLTKELLEIALREARRVPEGNDPNWRYAHQWLSDRLLGKPKEVVEHHFGAGDSDEDADYTKLSEEELDAIIARGRPEPDDPAVH
jgi:hypothetical protein